MKQFLILTAMILGLPAFGQSTWRNFFTTNQNPIVEVVAGSNATVQASTVGVNLRRFTVNGTGSGGSGQTNWPQSAITNQTPRSLGFGFDGGGATLQAGTRGLVTIPYTGTIQSCTLMAYPSGSIEVRLWRTNSADASFPPTSAGAIGTNALTSDNYNIDATLTGWTTLVSSGDVFTVSIPTNALSITNLTMQLKIQP